MQERWKKIANLASGYCGVYEFMMLMEEKGLAVGASEYFYDDGEDSYEEEDDIEFEYNYLEIPVTKGILSDHGKKYLGIAVSEFYSHQDKRDSCFVLYDIEKKTVSHSFKYVEDNEAFKQEYNIKSFSRAVSDKGAYFFCDGIFDSNNISKDFKLYVYDKDLQMQLCAISLSKYIKNEEGACWDHTFTLEDAIKANNEEILIGIARGFTENPSFSILKYNIKKRSLFALDQKFIKTINNKYKSLFDLRFTYNCENIKIAVKCSYDNCSEAEPFRASQWDDIGFDIIDNQLSGKHEALFSYRLEGNVLPDIESGYEPAQGCDYDTFYVTNEQGKRILDLAIPFDGYIVSAISTDIPLLTYTKFEDKNSRTYVLKDTEKGLNLVKTIDANLPKHSVDDENKAILLYENAQTIILQ